MEIERKFLLSSLPDKEMLKKSVEITQAYISREPVLRIRKWDDSYRFTYKSSGLMCHQEEEFEISKEDYLKLEQKIEGIPIVKTRYLIEYSYSEEKKYTIELDYFHGALDSLLLAEVEFSSEEEALQFTPPEWFGADVTFNGRFHNSYLTTLNAESAKEFIQSLSFYR